MQWPPSEAVARRSAAGSAVGGYAVASGQRPKACGSNALPGLLAAARNASLGVSMPRARANPAGSPDARAVIAAGAVAGEHHLDYVAWREAHDHVDRGLAASELLRLALAVAFAYGLRHVGEGESKEIFEAICGHAGSL